MRSKEAARGSGNYPRANVHCGDEEILALFGHASAWAGVIFAVSFGLMLVVAAWLGW